MAGRFSSRLCRLIIEPEPNLVGRWWEMSAIEGMLERAVDGHGAVVSVMGSPGMGKSVVREMAAMARRRDVEVFTALCESHTSQEKSQPHRAPRVLLTVAAALWKWSRFGVARWP